MNKQPVIPENFIRVSGRIHSSDKIWDAEKQEFVPIKVPLLGTLGYDAPAMVIRHHFDS